jgi:hypothetical protein
LYTHIDIRLELGETLTYSPLFGEDPLPFASGDVEQVTRGQSSTVCEHKSVTIVSARLYVIQEDRGIKLGDPFVELDECGFRSELRVKL